MTRNNHREHKVACILDKFSYECFKFECHLEQLRPDAWEDQMTKLKPDFLFVESAWRGVDNLWNGMLTSIGKKPGSEIRNVIRYCRENHIKTVFWNKDDDVKYDVFIDLAKLFDYVFTTDENCIEKYKADLNHNRIFVLPFAAQPAIHHPINRTFPAKRNIAFAGTWYAKNHHERIKDMEMILNSAKPFGLDIFDRHHMQFNNRYRYPEQFQKHIVGSLDYKEIIERYKHYKIILNVNSVRDSPTMFSRRVFEILGSGTNVVSTYSRGIEQLFAHLIPIVTSEEEAAKYLRFLLNNSEYRERLSLLGIREIHSKHLYKHRFDEILNKIGIKSNHDSPAGVSVITCTTRINNMNNVFRNFQQQAWQEKELIVILNRDDLQKSEWRKRAKEFDNIYIYQLPEKKPLGKCLNYAVAKAKYDYIAKFDDDDYYAPNYLVDAMHAFRYSDADIVGKHAYYSYAENIQALTLRFARYENQFVRFVAGPTLLIKKEVFNKVKWPNKDRGEDTEFLKECHANGFKIYSTDKYNFCYIRSIPENHTWGIGGLEFLQKGSICLYTSDFKTHVTV
jgi:Uncharacterized protein conserved in bacteria